MSPGRPQNCRTMLSRSCRSINCRCPEERVEERGIPVLLNHRCVSINHEAGKVESITVATNGKMSREKNGDLTP